MTVLLVLGAVAAPAEVVYMACSNQTIDEPLPGDDDNVVTKLYEVTLDDGSGQAMLTEIAVSRFNQADAIACNQDDRCYIFDRFQEGHPNWGDGGLVEEYVIGVPEAQRVSDSILADITMGFPVSLQGVVLAAFHPDGTLYGASQDDDLFFTIDLDLANDMDNPVGEAVGANGTILVDGVPLDIEGADLVFTADHRGYLWTNGLTPGLYEIFLPQDELSDTTAVKLDAAPPVMPMHFATGLAVRDFGLGEILMASTLDEITEHAQGLDGEVVQTFQMVNEDPNFDHRSGDMAMTYLCEMQCAVDREVVEPGEELTVAVDLFHNASRVAHQRFAIELIDSAGQVRFTTESPVQTFTQGDHASFQVPFRVPQRAAAGQYTIRMGIAGMQQGEARTECGFEVTSPIFPNEENGG